MTSEPLAIVVLGMHRSGTSCLAGMLAAGGLASAGEAVRNWDNARGHYEMLDVVRLNEAVLAHSGGHWLSPPAAVRWTEEHAAARDRLLRARIDGRPALLKDPRTLLALPFWRASSVPFHAIGIVRHPLAVARSLESWRGMPLAEGIALWSAHDRVLAEDHARHGYALVDFEQPKAAVVAAVIAACAPLGRAIDEAALAAAYEEQLVHHDDGDAPAVAGLDEAVALYRRLAGVCLKAGAGRRWGEREGGDGGEREGEGRRGSERKSGDGGESEGEGRRGSERKSGDGGESKGEGRRGSERRGGDGSGGASGGEDQVAVAARPAFPRAELAAFERLLRDGATAAALEPARAALASVADAAAVLVPVVTSLVRRRAYAEACALIAEHAARLDAGLADLLYGKLLLAAGDPAGAVRHLEAACAVPQPLFQARHLLPQALRGAGRHAEARAALRRVAGEALYPHGPLATLAEWSWLDGDRREAMAEMERAIAAAPLHRRGRLRTRRAEWLLAQGDPAAARAELLQALDEDPGYGRSREVLASIA